MTEKKPDGISWESFAEHQIREAQLAGEFENLPGFGQPLPDIDEPYDESWWVKKKLRSEKMSLLPPSLEIRAIVDKTVEAAMTLKTESEVRRMIEELNEKIRQANFAITWGPASTTMPLDIDEVVKRWRMNRA